MSNESQKNGPDFFVYGVRERDRGQKAIWTRVGAIFKHQKGEGFNIDIEALPINFQGRLVAMPPKNTVEE